MRFLFEHLVPLDRGSVFEFFQNPARLALLHAGWSRLRLLHHQAHVHVGAQTWVEVPFAGFIPLVLGFRHALFEPPVRFSEEAIHGPFSCFSHTHEFIDHGSNTLVRDILELRLPWYYGGNTAIRYAVAPVVRKMFHHRAQALLRLITNGTVTSCVMRAFSEKS